MKLRAMVALVCGGVFGAPALGQPQWMEVPPPETAMVTPPDMPREFRGVWIASVQNIDWPSAKKLTVAQQTAEITRNLDGLSKMNINAVLLQVRPSGDALYVSSLEPWSEYLTGASGIAPDVEGYDPLRLWIEEAHRRAIDVHVWINPFRVRHFKAESANAPSHIARTHPELVRSYDGYEWLDPGEPAAIDHSMKVVMDIVNRYDIDGVAIDDYFYPYPKDKEPFPDDASYQKYVSTTKQPGGGGPLTRDLWRQQNINVFVERFYREIKAAKPYVLVGIAPFGIWRPGNPPGIKGMDAVAKLHADAKVWLANGWLDYLSPQLYWSIDSIEQNFVKLLVWWAGENVKERHLWPSLYTSRIGQKTADPQNNWIPDEISKQILVTRERAGNAGIAFPGQIHFSLKVMLENRGGINQVIMARYAAPALIPESPWLDDGGFAKQPWHAMIALDQSRTSIAWAPYEFSPMPARWVIQTRTGDNWASAILPGTQAEASFDIGPDAVVLTPVSRTGMSGTPKKWELKQMKR
ncbi:MAG: family 10 glycosylhydrolase [Phycisphaerales bacterium]